MKEGKVIFAVGEFTTGINISSSVDITLKSVSVYSENIINPIVPIVIWEGERNLGNWDNSLSIQYDNFLSKTKAGDTWRVFYKDADVSSGAQLQFPYSTAAAIGINNVSGYSDYEVTEELIGKITSDYNKMSFNGKNMTITKIVLIPAASSDGE